MRTQLFRAYIEKAIGHRMEESELVYLTGDEAAEALLTLTGRFAKNIAQIRSIPYNSSFEKEADAIIESEVLRNTDWSAASAEAWRVLLERLSQALMVAQLNQFHQKPLIPIPEDLPADAWTSAAMIFLMYDMKLPFPLTDKSDFSFPMRTVPGSLTRQ
ncbi:hypothetical protein [Methylobacter sp.]|uniref:hypothetical protein n=1 Tax=Methylobacter sp. TaxID=2051955 RepID=UPI0024878148|nr:hypothetical protein [Methylobacter sp.]MDI1278042.1 hypothetical protein [Methylobacter sp.]